MLKLQGNSSYLKLGNPNELFIPRASQNPNPRTGKSEGKESDEDKTTMKATHKCGGGSGVASGRPHATWGAGHAARCRIGREEEREEGERETEGEAGEGGREEEEEVERGRRGPHVPRAVAAVHVGRKSESERRKRERRGQEEEEGSSRGIYCSVRQSHF